MRYEAEIDLRAITNKRNRSVCSICRKTASWGTFVTPSAFKLLSGEESLADYRLGAETVGHTF